MLAARLGVDALGFILAESPRKVTPQEARAIIHNLPPFVKTVGVFVNEEPAKIKEIQSECGFDLVQLHGDETPAQCRELRSCSIKAFRIKDRADLERMDGYQGAVRAILLDTYQKGKAGGTGKTFDWSLAVKARRSGVPVILAGGLTPANIQDAITRVRPYAVDVNSGIEERPGKKDPDLMNLLFERIRSLRQ